MCVNVYIKKIVIFSCPPRVDVCSLCRLLSSCLFHISFSAPFASCLSRLNCPVLCFKNIIRGTGVSTIIINIIISKPRGPYLPFF